MCTCHAIVNIGTARKATVDQAGTADLLQDAAGIVTGITVETMAGITVEITTGIMTTAGAMMTTMDAITKKAAGFT
ncbi:hypothetical protein GCM10011396_25620 [Undibacterium terreum]|uniref:Uncharacterized protein n=1 Tax=Undibacterium terreum TaxID=1224302 RepID=A0A916UNM4_9BURK|nr:hypothetical protein GCM10011396_25620 [Undibacterium terreum]